jgi:hypothetical protein
LLRAEVASHYQLFMRSTEDIQHVEADIARLRRHVGRMQKSLKALDGAMTTTLSGAAADNVSIAFAASSKVRESSIAIKDMEDGGQDGIGARARDVASLPECLRSWGATGATGKRGMTEEGRGGGSDGFKGGLHHHSNDPAANLSSGLEGKGPSGQPAPNALVRGDDLPVWVAAALEDLDKCIVENQRSVAVNHIVKLRALLASLSPSRASSPHSQDLQGRVTSKGKEIAGRIIRELDALAPGANLSILFDFADMAQQLRFLVALDEAETAVDFFVRNKGGVLARALHSPETSGEPLVYVAVLAERFFGLMADACESFDALFAVSVSEGRSEAITAGGTPITPSPNFEAFTSTDVENQRGGPMSTPGPSVRPPKCFLRLVLWVEEEVRQFAVLVGRQLRSLRQDWLLYRLRVAGKAQGKDGKLAKGMIAGSGGDGTGKVVEGLSPCEARQGPPRPTLSPPCLPLSLSHPFTPVSSSLLSRHLSSLFLTVAAVQNGAGFFPESSFCGVGQVGRPKGATGWHAALSETRCLLLTMVNAPPPGAPVTHPQRTLPSLFFSSFLFFSSLTLPTGAVRCHPAFITAGACLEVCFSLASKLDALGIPVAPVFAHGLASDLSFLLGGVRSAAWVRMEDAMATERESGARVVVVGEEALVLVTPGNVVSKLHKMVSEDENEGEAEVIGTRDSEAGSAGNGMDTASEETAARGSCSSTPPMGNAPAHPVFPSTLLLLEALNALMVSCVAMLDPTGERPRSWEVLGPALGAALVKEACGLLRDYAEEVAKMVASMERKGEDQGRKPMGHASVCTEGSPEWRERGGPSTEEREATARRPREAAASLNPRPSLRESAARVLGALTDITLQNLRQWTEDPWVLVDATAIEIEEVRSVFDLYTRTADAMGEKAAAVEASAAAISSPPKSGSAPPVKQPPSGTSPPSGVFSRLTLEK